MTRECSMIGCRMPFRVLYRDAKGYEYVRCNAHRTDCTDDEEMLDLDSPEAKYGRKDGPVYFAHAAEINQEDGYSSGGEWPDLPARDEDVPEKKEPGLDREADDPANELESIRGPGKLGEWGVDE